MRGRALMTQNAQRLALLFASVALLLSHGVQGDGCHEPSKDIGDEAGLAGDICTLTAALKRSPPDYVTAEAYYRLGSESKDVTLMEIATGKALSSNFSNASMELFEDEDWMHDLLLGAFEDEGIFEDLDDLRRATFIEKILQGGALSHRLFTNLREAYTQAEDGNLENALEYLERAMANFFGSESECSIFGTGQLRGIEFGIMKGGASLANYDTVAAFGDSALAIEEDPIDLKSLQNAFDDIRKHVITTYLQCIVKYSTKMAMDEDSVEAQAEAFGYYHAIAGQVKKLLPEAHETMYAAFVFPDDPDPEKAAKVKGAVDDILEELGVSKEEFGTYDSEARDNYEEPKEVECNAVNPFQDEFVELIDFDR